MLDVIGPVVERARRAGLGHAMRVLAAMSGGVDSAVAAALAVDAGHDVTGVHLALSPDRQTLRSGARGCCSVEDAHDARRVADELGIPFYVWDLAERFTEDVVDDFVAEYAAGRTPNPCLRCNEKIKFTAVLDRARALGFDAVVTGHHARLADGALRRSVDAAKDQSYVLGVLTPEQLAGRDVPAGLHDQGAGAGDRRRARLRRRGQAGLARHLLHPRRRHPRLPRPPAGQPAGPGRRRGHRRDGRASTTAPTGSPSASAAGSGVAVGDQRPRYVLGIEPVSRTVTDRDGGPRRGRRGVRTGPPPGPATRPDLPFAAQVQLRAHAAPVRLRGERRGRRRAADRPRRAAARRRPGTVRGAVRAGRRARRPGARPGRCARRRVNVTKRFVTRTLGIAAAIG